MEITVDLQSCKDENSVLLKFGEVFEFKVSGMPNGEDWGVNWDALQDCLRYVDEGLNSKKFEFPLTLKIHNSEEFKNAQPEKFRILEDVLNTVTEEYKEKGKVFEVIFA